MEVTSMNFQDVLEELDVLLKNATFLGIDGEFSGLNIISSSSAFDSPDQYYAKLRRLMDFLLIQFGLAVFTFDTKTQTYSQRSYNFYIFPRSSNLVVPNRTFLCQASSIEFLASKGFDFNKLFNSGISYLTASEARKMLGHVGTEYMAKNDSLVTMCIPVSDRPQVEEICTRISKFIPSKESELVIERCNTFIRRLVCQEIRLRWPNQLIVQTEYSNGGCKIVIQKLGSKEDEKQRREKCLLHVKQALGIRELMIKIVNSGKLIVGHNMLFDLCHILHQFFEELPESYLEFKSLIHTLFPRLLDTKVLCQSERLKDVVKTSNLTVLEKTVRKPPFKVMEVESMEGRNYDIDSDKYHEAGYDAFVTGMCFIALANYLGSFEEPKVPIVLPDSPVLAPFLNKLFVGVLKDFPYINLVGDDIKPNRDYVFHLRFPKEWKSNNIYKLFKPFGSVHIVWLNDTSAYVELHCQDQSQVVMQMIGKGTTYEIRTYNDYQDSLKSQSSPEYSIDS